MAVQGFFSPDRKTRMAGEKENNAAFSVKVEPVRVANNINQYNDQTPSLDYAPDRVGDYIRDSETKSYRDDRSQEEKDRDAIKNFFTREEGGAFKDKDEFDRKMTTYYTDRDGNPAAVDAFGERVYDTDKIKKYIAADAKEQYQTEQKRKLDDAVTGLNIMNQKVDDFNYYKRNLDFNEKGEADPANKYVLTAPEMRERIKKLGVNETMDKYGIIRPYKRQEQQQTEDTRKLGTMPSMGISEAGREEAKLNRLQKAKEGEGENKNVFQKIGDTVGNVFNKLTGTEAAGAGTLQSQGINTSATTNLSRINNTNPTVQRARQAVERSVRQQTGMSSNPGSQRQTGVGVSAGNLSRHKAGPSTSRSGVSRSTSRGQGGGSSSRSRGGTGAGRSSQGSKSSARGAKGSSTSRSRGGTGSGRTSTSRSASKASRSRTGRSRTRCDIRTKIDISPLINSNLVKDNLAEVAYFVQEIKK
jgi:hypothetical protein